MATGPRDIIDPNKFFPNTLLFMENSLLAFLQALFSTFPQDTGCFHYNDSSDLTEIKIEGQGTDNLDSVDTRPKITVFRGNVGWNLAGINGSVGSKNLSQLQVRHTAILSGTVGISCYAREDLEADRIANICASAVEAFSPVIRRFGFLQVHTAQIGQRAQIGADSRPELFVTPVLIKAEVTKNWNREIVDPVLLRKVLIQYVTTPKVGP